MAHLPDQWTAALWVEELFLGTADFWRSHISTQWDSFRVPDGTKEIFLTAIGQFMENRNILNLPFNVFHPAFNDELLRSDFDREEPRPFQYESTARQGEIHVWKIRDRMPAKRINSWNEDPELQKFCSHLLFVRFFFQAQYDCDVTKGDLGLTVYIGSPFSLNRSYAVPNKKTIVLGAVDTNHLNPLFDQLDIIAHEVAHIALWMFGWELQSPGGSLGALEESFCDVCAIQMKNCLRGAQPSQGGAIWTIGEIFLKPRGSARSLLSPGQARDYSHYVFQTDSQVSHIDRYRDDPSGDFTYDNAGIPSHAFYLAARDIGNNTWEEIGKVWISAMQLTFRECSQLNFNNGSLGFRVFAYHSFVSAQMMSNSERLSEAVQSAWEGVGIRCTELADI